MRWRKEGRIFAPSAGPSWMRSHAANPFAWPMGGDRFRVYFSPRDDENRSRIAFFEMDLQRPSETFAISEEPVVSPGPPGSFDDSGTSMGCLVNDGSRTLLYYVGWNLGATVPWRNSIGLAISEGAGAPFVKHSRAPLLDRSDEDPYSLSYPWVMRDGDVYRMWYGSNLSWGRDARDMRHVIKYAESDDGIRWRRTGEVCIDLAPGELGVSRPCVVRDPDRYRMWYARRSATYRLGYAESQDGRRWERRDAEVGLDVSAEGWDSDMVEYACVFDHGGRRFMLYNGNGYGRTGIGLAVLEPEPAA